MQRGAVLVAADEQWVPAGEHRASAPFNPQTPSRCVICTVDGTESPIIVWNAVRCLLIGALQSTGAVDARVVEVLGSTPGHAAYPSCLSHNAASPDELDLLVGLVNGRISLFSLAALVAPGSPPFATPRESHDAAASGGACLSVSWVPGTAGSSFVSAHADGSVVVHHRLPGNSLDAGLLRRSNSQLCASLRLAPERPGANEAAHTRLAAPSPRGSYVAVAGRDGACTIQHWTSRRRIGAFRTWYGGVTCLAWSGDERLVAAGGEDDLVHVYSVPDDSLVAVCRGHASWVAAVAFDPRPGPGAPEEEGGEGQAEYRLASVGDDGRFCVWHLRCSPSQKPRSEAGHIAWAPQRQRRRSELPYAEPSIRTRVSVEPLSDIQLDSEGVVLITNRGGMLSYRRKMAVGPAEPPCQEEDVR